MSGLSQILASMVSLKFVAQIIRMSTGLFFAATASFVAASTGVGNIAIESIMTMSALFGVLGSYWTQSAIGGLVIGIACGILMAAIIAFFSMRLGASPILVGIALNTFAGSLATFFLYQFTGSKGSSASLRTPGFGSWDIPVIKDIPVLGEILSGHYVLTYVCVAVVILLYILIFKTPLGMRMRACGLNADAAKTAGINVDRLRLLSLILSGILSALGGVFIALNYINLYSSGMISGQGWMGIAANGIAQGNYLSLILAVLAFGLFKAVAVVFVGTEFPSELIGSIPYIAVFVGIALISVINYYRVKKGNVAEK